MCKQVKVIVILIFWTSLAYCKIGGSIVVGGSKAIGYGSEQVKLGFNAGGTLYGEFRDYFYIGGNFNFNNWFYKTIKDSNISIDAERRHFGFSPLVRIVKNLNRKTNIFIEPAPGLYFGHMKIYPSFHKDDAIKLKLGPNFGFSICGGFNISNIELKPGFYGIVGKDEFLKWLTISMGFCF